MKDSAFWRRLHGGSAPSRLALLLASRWNSSEPGSLNGPSGSACQVGRAFCWWLRSSVLLPFLVFSSFGSSDTLARLSPAFERQTFMNPAASHSLLRSTIAWLVLFVAALGTLYLLNGAAFSAWMSGGPPNPYPQGWAMRSQAQLTWAVAVAVGGFAVFRTLREFPRLRRLTIALLAVSMGLAIFPSANKALQIDRCLDSGGRWNYEGRQCER